MGPSEQDTNPNGRHVSEMLEELGVARCSNIATSGKETALCRAAHSEGNDRPTRIFALRWKARMLGHLADRGCEFPDFEASEILEGQHRIFEASQVP